MVSHAFIISMFQSLSNFLYYEVKVSKRERESVRGLTDFFQLKVDKHVFFVGIVSSLIVYSVCKFESRAEKFNLFKMTLTLQRKEQQFFRDDL